MSDSVSIDWEARIEEALTEQPHLRRVRCRCKGCQGPPSCWCCVELHLFPMDVPDDIEDDQDDTELGQPDDQSVIHWHDRAVAAEAALAEATARADRLAVEVEELRAALAGLRETGPDEPLMAELPPSRASYFWFCGRPPRKGHDPECAWERCMALLDRYRALGVVGEGT